MNTLLSQWLVSDSRKTVMDRGSPDTIGPAGGINLYAYANNDPLSYIDPLGLCPEDELESYRMRIREYINNVPNPDSDNTSNGAVSKISYLIKGAMLFHGGQGLLNNDMDLKTRSPEEYKTTEWGVITSSEAGNYLAGYYAGYSESSIIYIGMRVGGLWFSSVGWIRALRDENLPHEDFFRSREPTCA